MIYTVECAFSDPATEAEWNDFYSLEKLPALISVTGFRTSQRFKATRNGCPTYLAVHTIDSLDVLTGAEYREKGGGNFARWQPHITDWHRNLYSDIGLAPAVDEDAFLVLSENGGGPFAALGLTPLAMHAVALDRFPQRRWLATLPKDKLPHVEHLPPDLFVYSPMTEQLTSKDRTRSDRIS